MSQIRQDLNNFGGFGQQGYGYNVEDHIGSWVILGLDQQYNVVVAGAGNLGHAITSIEGLKKWIQHCRSLDKNPDNPRYAGRNLEVKHLDGLEDL